jgi:myosin heavy subunit
MTSSSHLPSFSPWLKYVGLVLGTVGVVAIASWLSLKHAVVLLSLVAIGLTLWLYRQSTLNQALQQTVNWHKRTLANSESRAQNREAELQQQLQDSSYHQQTATDQVNLLTDQLEKTRHRLTTLAEEQTRQQQETTVLAQQLHTAHQTIRDLSTQLEQAKNEHDFYVSQCDRHAQEAQEAKASLEMAINDRDRLLDGQHNLHQQLEQVRSQLAEAQAANADLQAELAETRQQIDDLTPTPPPSFFSRPPKMSDQKFARFAAIELQKFPIASHIESAAKQHYQTINADNRQPVTFNALVDFLRHRFTNYETLCDELDRSSYYARNILKARVNAAICLKLAEMRISIRN